MENDARSHDDREAHECEPDQIVADIVEKLGAELVTEDEIFDQLMDVARIRGSAEKIKAARTLVRSFTANAVPVINADCDTTTTLLAFGDDLPVGGYAFRIGIAGLAAQTTTKNAPAHITNAAKTQIIPQSLLVGVGVAWRDQQGPSPPVRQALERERRKLSRSSYPLPLR